MNTDNIKLKLENAYKNNDKCILLNEIEKEKLKWFYYINKINVMENTTFEDAYHETMAIDDTHYKGIPVIVRETCGSKND
jgi:hypothetical protein